MLYTVDSEVFNRFESFKRVVVVAKNIDNTGTMPELERFLRQCEDGVRTDDMAEFKAHPSLATWIDVFSKMGLNPNKYPPSIVNLVKRVRAGKPIPYVNSLVALFNCISLKYLVPCGGDDLNVVEGDLRLGISTGQENYVPLGQPEVLEHPPVGEVIYFDSGNKDVFCRIWCWKNGDRSKLTPETTMAAINIDAMSPVSLEHIQNAAQELVDLLQKYTKASTSVHILTKENSEFNISV